MVFLPASASLAGARERPPLTSGSLGKGWAFGSYPSREYLEKHHQYYDWDVSSLTGSLRIRKVNDNFWNDDNIPQARYQDYFPYQDSFFCQRTLCYGGGVFEAYDNGEFGGEIDYSNKSNEYVIRKDKSVLSVFLLHGNPYFLEDSMELNSGGIYKLEKSWGKYTAKEVCSLPEYPYFGYLADDGTLYLMGRSTISIISNDEIEVMPGTWKYVPDGITDIAVLNDRIYISNMCGISVFDMITQQQYVYVPTNTQ